MKLLKTVCFVLGSFTISTVGFGSGNGEGYNFGLPGLEDAVKRWPVKGFASPPKLQQTNVSTPITGSSQTINVPTWNDIKFNNPKNPFDYFGCNNPRTPAPNRQPQKPSVPSQPRKNVRPAETAEDRLAKQKQVAEALDDAARVKAALAGDSGNNTERLKRLLEEENDRAVQQDKIDSERRKANLRDFKDLCFPGETLVLVKDESQKGYHSQAISTINVGDSVVACNLRVEGGRCEFGEVEEVFKRKTDRLIELTFSEEAHRATGNHPFYLADQRIWTEAQEVETGNLLLHVSGEPVEIQAKKEVEGDFTVYNLSVKGFHNYYAHEVLVHNCKAVAEKRAAEAKVAEEQIKAQKAQADAAAKEQASAQAEQASKNPDPVFSEPGTAEGKASTEPGVTDRQNSTKTEKGSAPQETAKPEAEAQEANRLAEDAPLEPSYPEDYLTLGKGLAKGVFNVVKNPSVVPKAMKGLFNLGKNAKNGLKTFCFPADTPVCVSVSEDDQNLNAISDIKVGDWVESCDMDKNPVKCERHQVTKVYETTADHLIEIIFQCHSLKATPDHPFYVPSKQKWIKAKKLSRGDDLQLISGESVRIEEIVHHDAKKENENGAEYPVYNLEVDGTHTYYAARVLVHNCDEGIKKAKNLVGGAAKAEGEIGAKSVFGNIGAGVADSAGQAERKIVDKWSRVPETLQDQMVLEAAKKGVGKPIIKDLKDPRYKGMEKWEYKEKSTEGKDTVVHWVRDPKTGKAMDFKFKKHSNQ